MKTIVSVEEFIIKNEKWQDSLILLHELITSCGLEECIKWSTPVYTLKNKNVVGVGAFKHHFALWFFQGVFLSDPKKVLINAAEGTAKAYRQLRFKNFNDIDEEIVLSYVQEAIENQKAGKELKPTRVHEIVIPVELKHAFNADKELKKYFMQLSNSKQYEYTRYISRAKREETRLKRLDKCIPLILDGVGLYNKYS